MQNNQTLKSFDTLKRSSDFAAIRQSGSVVKHANWLMLSYKKNELNQLRLGITISRKVGGAVVRNKFKRWSKNIVRDHVVKQKFDLQLSEPGSKEGFDVNIVFKPVSDEFYKKLQFTEYKTALLLLFNKALR